MMAGTAYSNHNLSTDIVKSQATHSSSCTVKHVAGCNTGTMAAMLYCINAAQQVAAQVFCQSILVRDTCTLVDVGSSTSDSSTF